MLVVIALNTLQTWLVWELLTCYKTIWLVRITNHSANHVDPSVSLYCNWSILEIRKWFTASLLFSVSVQFLTWKHSSSLMHSYPQDIPAEPHQQPGQTETGLFVRVHLYTSMLHYCMHYIRKYFEKKCKINGLHKYLFQKK